MQLTMHYLKVLLLFLVLLCCACSSSSDGSEDQTDPEQNDTPTEVGDISFGTLCGVAEVARLINPVTDAEFVAVEVLNSNEVIISSADDPNDPERRLVKLHGITASGVNPFRQLHGASVMEQALLGRGYFVPAGPSCPYVVNGQEVGVLGQIFSADGQSMSELMLQQGAAVPLAETCDGDQLAVCYETIGVVARPPSDVELDLVPTQISSSCGAVKDGIIVNPVTAAEEVGVQAVAANEVIITRFRGVEAGNQQLVKLHGLSTAGIPAFRLAQGINLINSAGAAYFLAASHGCGAVLPSGGLGVYGQLYTREGVSINEELLRMGSVLAEADPCSGDLLLACYQTVQAEAPDPGDEPVSDLIIDNFLWKPVSEANGNLVVLVNPQGVQVLVTGAVTETLTDFGPSNDRGTTARGGRPGCGYGSNIRVDFFDGEGRRVYIANGADSVSIPNGCDRVEFRL